MAIFFGFGRGAAYRTNTKCSFDNSAIFLFVHFAYNLSNAALSSLLRFFRFFIRTLGIPFQCELLVHASDSIPICLEQFTKCWVQVVTPLRSMLCVGSAIQFTTTMIASISNVMGHQLPSYAAMLHILTILSNLGEHLVILCF